MRSVRSSFAALAHHLRSMAAKGQLGPAKVSIDAAESAVRIRAGKLRLDLVLRESAEATGRGIASASVVCWVMLEDGVGVRRSVLDCLGIEPDGRFYSRLRRGESSSQHVMLADEVLRLMQRLLEGAVECLQFPALPVR